MCASIMLTMIVPCPNAELACMIHIIGVFALWIRVVDAGRWLRRAFICHGLLCTGPARRRGRGCDFLSLSLSPGVARSHHLRSKELMVLPPEINDHVRLEVPIRNGVGHGQDAKHARALLEDDLPARSLGLLLLLRLLGLWSEER